jgi:hypothetical protein
VSEAFVAASPALARALAALAAAVVALAALRAWRRPDAPAPALEPSRATEAALVVAIVAAALAMRLAGPTSLTAPWWFAEKTPLEVAKLLHEGTTWLHWRATLRNVQVIWLEESAVLLPVAVAMQRLLGPSFELPLFFGAFHGALVVLLAWLSGRALHSRAFGLLFAAFVAASPLGIVWSRIGDRWIAGLVPVLGVLWIGHRAGRRGSVPLALATGVLTWTSLYSYLSARVAFALAPLAIVAGASDGGVRMRRTFAALVLWAVALVGIYAAIRPGKVGETLWPTYAGYVGNKGEHGVADFLANDVAPIVTQARRALAVYLLQDRATFARGTSWFQWDVRAGGHVLAPVALLGIVGLAVALRRPRRHWIWLAVTAVGLAVPALSLTTARRLLVLDVGWCALAAAGLLALLRSRLGRALSVPGRVAVAVGVPLLTAGWAFATVVALHRLLPGGVQPIPFGEAGFGDGRTCKRCIEAARAWQHAIAAGELVVLVDGDVEREDRTCPAGLPMYGKLAAVAAGHPTAFVELYSLMQDWDSEPPDYRPFFDVRNDDFGTYLERRVAAVAPRVIRWHFEHPTAWERWLAGRLASADGAVTTTFATPLGDPDGLEVRVPAEGVPSALAVVRELAAPVRRDDDAPALRLLARVHVDVPPFLLAPGADAPADPQGWAVGTWRSLRLRGATFDGALPAAARVDPNGQRVEVVDRTGHRTLHDLAGATLPAGGAPGPVGLGCAARVGDTWWVVDPSAGTVRGAGATGWLPDARWIGIARGPDDAVVLGAADQWIGVYDPRSRRELLRFPAAVWPSRRHTDDECAPVLAGDGWYATFWYSTSVLTLYDADGAPAGTRRLDRVLGLGGNSISAIGAAGRVLAVGFAQDVATLELVPRSGPPVPEPEP